MIYLIVIIIIAILIVILPISLYLNYIRIIKRNYKIEQEAYMKKYPDSYGIGELQV